MTIRPNLTLPLIAISTIYIVQYRCLFDSLLKVEADIKNQLLSRCIGAFPNCVSAPIILVVHVAENRVADLQVLH